MNILLYVIGGIVCVTAGWFAHMLWFKLYYRRFMVKTNKSFMIVNLNHLHEAFDYFSNEEYEEDFIIEGDK